MLPGGKLTTLASGVPLDQKVNKAEELTYLSTSIGMTKLLTDNGFKM
jgi:hypothetical protein